MILPLSGSASVRIPLSLFWLVSRPNIWITLAAGIAVPGEIAELLSATSVINEVGTTGGDGPPAVLIMPAWEIFHLAIYHV